MAYSPEKKAEIVADYLGGLGWQGVREKYGVSKSTLSGWLKNIEPKANTSELSNIPQAAREERFNIALDNFLMATMKMLHTWAEVCSDPKFVKAKPSGANELGTTVFKSAERIIAATRGSTEAETEDVGN